MLNKGDIISYGTTGVCKVEGECEQTVKGKKKRYIVLKPIHQNNSTLYVPMDNDELKTKFKPLLTKAEIDDIIKEMPEDNIWFESSSERAELYSDILESGDRKRLAQLVRTLYLRQKSLIAKGRHLHSNDERIFKSAEALLFDEFSAVLGIGQEEVFDFIQTRLSKA
ncbi:CarD family transcriptional regulator [Ruminococcus sp.]|uniref:CarD family transcriptional regulator n=1 Tax=Ruminococcus sp. TaxID=41978 RepID=UPI0025FB2398|nr:CarD family transcriptional regulator [Ruminococcus sp.]